MIRLRALFKPLYPPDHLALSFKQENTLYNNRAFAYFSVFISLLLLGGALSMGLFSSSPAAANYEALRLTCLISIAVPLFSFLLLTVIYKRLPKLMWLTNPLTIAECILFVFAIMASSHFELTGGGDKHIEPLMIAQFVLVFLCRHDAGTLFGLQTLFIAGFITQLCLEKPYIDNFPPYLINLIATYAICLLASFLSVRSRVRHFMDKKNLEALVSVDYLTNVHTRRGFEYLLQINWAEALAARTSLAFLMVDIDDFKLYNDHYGRQTGDKCLSVVAKVIVDSVRKSDFVSRYGGEEFAVILYDTPRDAIERIIRRMFEEMERQSLPHIGSRYKYVTFSLGAIFCYPGETDSTPENFIRKANEALYTAKSHGKNRAAFHPDSV